MGEETLPADVDQWSQNIGNVGEMQQLYTSHRLFIGSCLDKL